MRTLTLKIGREQDGRTVKNLLKNELCASDAHISRLKRRENGILLNGTKCYVTARVAEGDELTMEIGDRPDGHIVPKPFPLNVRFEDEDLLIIDKSAGIAVHQSTHDPDECTLENAVCFYLGGNITPHPVSRLDRGTSGLMVFAKSGYIHERLKRVMHTDAFTRTYEGIAAGRVEPPSGTIELPIGMADGSTYRRAVRDDGAAALTEYETISANECFTLLKLIPHTGRTHQLRLHMAAIGCPLVGDWLYGQEAPGLITRPALHSAALRVEHPITGERIELRSELPDDMCSLMQPRQQKQKKQGESGMTTRIIHENGQKIALIESETVLITGVQSALDLMATVQYETDSVRIALKKDAVAEEFFILSTRLAGDVLQKFVNYGVKLAIIGDYSCYTSKPLKDFIYESNGGHHVFFVSSEEEAVEKLANAK